MKLQIKTFNQKSLLIDIEDEKTVYELKQELSNYPDVGVRPELQRLIYGGKILSNNEPLNAYNIDVKKFLVVMILKQPEEDAAEAASTAPSASQLAETATPPKEKDSKTVAASDSCTSTTPAPTTPPPARRNSRDELVQNIVGMGYPESEVRRALEASFYSPERAIEYLVEGIPDSVVGSNIDYNDYTEDYNDMLTPIEVFRRDPQFRNLRRAIQQHPELIDDAIQQVGEANPAILQLINENQEEFLSMLVDGSDGEDEDDEESS